MKKFIIIILGSTVVLLALFSYQTQTFSDKKLHIIFCNVGQGDAIYARTPGGADILIDGGPNDSVLKCLARHMPFWDKELELVFATHPDADHISGLVQILQKYKVDSFNTVSATKNTKVFNQIQTLIGNEKIPYKELKTGDKFDLSDGVEVDTLWPAPEFSSKDINEYSLVQDLKYGEFDLLLTGDITSRILDSLNLSNFSIEIIKMPHHGSKTGVDDKTFEEIHPVFAAISDGKNNSYHHPHPSVLSLLRKYNIKYERTDEVGDIEVVTDGKTTKVLN